MTTTTVSKVVIREELTTGGRVAYGVLGAIVFFLGLFLLISGIQYGTHGGSGAFAQNFLEWLVIVALFAVGVLNLLSAGVPAEGDSGALRGIRAAIGVIVIVLGIVAIWPVAFGTTVGGWTAFTFLWVLVAVAFTLEGLFLILIGASTRVEGWQRGLAVALGVIVLIFGILAWAYPNFATFVVWSIFSIALLAFGLRFLIIAGTGIRVRRFTSVSVH
ncbi:MAG: hypothetical protein ACREBT_05140 [Thermoplasmata archaeon]